MQIKIPKFCNSDNIMLGDEMFMYKFETIKHKVDFCVVGGGLAGICAAVSAARNGASVAIMQDRPMFGGNCSSEIRMWVCGSSNYEDDTRETGILEEIDLENCYRNPYKNYSIWDSVLYQIVRYQKNITMLLNCSCLDARMDGNIIKSITGWQLTTQEYHEVEADIFADCSGDSILAPLSGAEFRWGREAKSEFNEDIAPDVEDGHTMGLSCMIQAREYTEPKKYIAPVWAEKFTSDKLIHRKPNMQNKDENFWYIELGGTGNTIKDSEDLRDELQQVAFGMWDYVKNSGECENTENWDLDWVGMIPGKRESRRYVGDYIMNQNDVRSEGKFDDLVAYGGWTMDDHHPQGLRYKGAPNIHHPAPSPFGIAYRCLYSKNIDNLMFAGRNISATHTAMSATRVMATCATMGQAVGTAAAIAKKYDTTPRGVYQSHINELKQTLMNDDCYLPFNTKEINALTKSAKVSTNGKNQDNLFNGIERDIKDTDNGWRGDKGAFVQFDLEKSERVSYVRIVFDSFLNRRHYGNYHHNMDANIHLDREPIAPPYKLVKSFDVSWQTTDGKCVTKTVDNNYQRLVKLPIDCDITSVKLTFNETWGADDCHVFAIELF